MALPRGIHVVLSMLPLHPEFIPNSASTKNTASTQSIDASRNISVSSAKRLRRMSSPLTFIRLISVLFFNLLVKIWATMIINIGDNGLP